MYGLPQAGILAYNLLVERLGKHGYSPCQTTTGLWRHSSRPISFVLTVNDFGIKYVGKHNAIHLIDTLKKYYEISIDWSGTKYCGLDISWNYPAKSVRISMPQYIPKLLHKLQHPSPTKPQHSPHPHVPIVFGATAQLVGTSPDSPRVSPSEIKYIQSVIGALLFYARAVDATLLKALSTLASEQNDATKATMAKIKQILDYVATHPDACVTYTYSAMHLVCHSDASYLSVTNARSRAGGHFFLSSPPTYKPNGAIHAVSQIVRNVMASATEAELAALYTNAREAVAIRNTLVNLGHPQPPTPIQTDSAMAAGLLLKTMQSKCTKAMDMRFHWLKDRQQQQQFKFFWQPGSLNLGDYYTKHHPASHHQKVRPTYIQ